MSSEPITKPFVKGKLVVTERDKSGKRTGQHNAVPGELITMSEENFKALSHCFEGDGKILDQDQKVVKALGCIDYLESMDDETKEIVQKAVDARMQAKNAEADTEGDGGKAGKAKKG